MNRTATGYRMLLILSAIDGKVDKRVDKIIRSYLKENFTEAVSYDKELELVNKLEYNDYAVHFNDAMNSFYMHSSQGERNHFLDIATKLVVADKEVSSRENLFLKELYNAWEGETEE